MLVLIAGITGALGQRLAKVALSRGLNLESFVTSKSYYDIPALDAAVSGVDAIINAYAPHPVLDLDGHLLLLRAAERAGIKIFVASSWSRDWTNIKFGDFEHYNNHLAFESQAATTSSINPVYVLTGIFTDLLFTPYGPGGYDASTATPRMKYWGDGDTSVHPWSAMNDAAEWTIDILLYGEGVQAGKGGFFKVRSGETTIKELAAVHERVFGIAVDVNREGSLAELEANLARLRKEKGRAQYIEWMAEAAAVIASKDGWRMRDVTVLEQFKKPITLEEHFREEKNNSA